MEEGTEREGGRIDGNMGLNTCSNLHTHAWTKAHTHIHIKAHT